MHSTCGFFFSLFHSSDQLKPVLKVTYNVLIKGKNNLSCKLHPSMSDVQASFCAYHVTQLRFTVPYDGVHELFVD